jgi:hypothetical protein
MKTDSFPSSDCRSRWLALGATALAGVLAISDQSYWIDEANAAYKAIQPTPAAWRTQMVALSGSDLQMPLYMFWIWIWEKGVGMGEWGMRLSGLPWFVLGTMVFAWRSRWNLLAVLLSPFAWYCLDELRPYAMQLGTSLLIWGAAARLLESFASRPCPDSVGRRCPGAQPADSESQPEDPPKPEQPSGLQREGTGDNRLWFAALGLGLIGLSGSSLIGMVWTGFALVGLAALWWPWRGRLRPLWPLAAVGLILLGALGVYYLWTLGQGARASAAFRTNLFSLAFVGYELLGFSGLGPGRQELRVAGVGGLRPFLPWLAVYGAVLVPLLLRGFWTGARASKRRVWLTVLVATLAGCAFVVTMGFAFHFRLLGRHFTPVAPLLFWVIARGIEDLWSRPGRTVGRLLVVAFVVASLASAASLRWAPRHAKDDYRKAAEWARRAMVEERTVWWNADAAAARLYGLNVSAVNQHPNNGQVLALMNPAREQLDQLPPPDLVLYSKPDIYDPQGVLREYLERHQFVPVVHLQAFVGYGPMDDSR